MTGCARQRGLGWCTFLACGQDEELLGQRLDLSLNRCGIEPLVGVGQDGFVVRADLLMALRALRRGGRGVVFLDDFRASSDLRDELLLGQEVVRQV